MKLHIKFLAFLLLFISTIIHSTPQDFNQTWQTMQHIYKQLSATCNQYAIDKNIFHTSYWTDCMQILRAILLNKPNENLLYTYDITNAMVRSNYEEAQEFEELYLDCCACPTIKEKIEQFKQNNHEPIWIPGDRSAKYNCSVNSLGHLYYVSRALEKNNNPEVVVEFGGGYGNLTRIIKMILPETTIISIDLPELLALQQLFLARMIPNTEIIIHYKECENFKKGAIHLLPIYFVEQSTINADLFISNFALTESPHYVQELINSKKFFNASTCYLTGQLEGWKNCGFQWIPHHEYLFTQARKLFHHIDLLPYHLFKHNLSSFELIAHVQKNKK